jgi:hypothetical protein
MGLPVAAGLWGDLEWMSRNHVNELNNQILNKSVTIEIFRDMRLIRHG